MTDKELAEARLRRYLGAFFFQSPGAEVEKWITRFQEEDINETDSYVITGHQKCLDMFVPYYLLTGSKLKNWKYLTSGDVVFHFFSDEEGGRLFDFTQEYVLIRCTPHEIKNKILHEMINTFSMSRLMQERKTVLLFTSLDIELRDKLTDSITERFKSIDFTAEGAPVEVNKKKIF